MMVTRRNDKQATRRASSAGLMSALAALLLFAHLPVLASEALADEAGLEGARPAGESFLVYIVEASNPVLHRRPIGEPSVEVEGVPASPVDAMTWDGSAGRRVPGTLRMEVYPASLIEIGSVEATWSDEHGTWGYEQLTFHHPEYPSGVRLAASAEAPRRRILNDGINTQVYVHGDTGAGGPTYPTAFAHLATWGTARLSLDGVRFDNPFGYPGPDAWDGHVMLTEGVRQGDGTMRLEDGSIFSPGRVAQGSVQPEDLEVHLIFHDLRGPAVPGNVPPRHQLYYGLTFEDVRVEVLQVDAPAPSAQRSSEFAVPEPSAPRSPRSASGARALAASETRSASAPRSRAERRVDARAERSPRREGRGGRSATMPAPVARGGAGSLVYMLEGFDPRVPRRALGSPERTIGGVAAAPVDALVLDGRGVAPAEGELELVLDASGGRGELVAAWRDERGSWRLRLAALGSPSLRGSLGVRFSGTKERLGGLSGPLALNHYREGDTGAGEPWAPAHAALLSLVGVAELTLDGAPFASPDPTSGGLFEAELVLREGVRSASGMIEGARPGVPFDPSRPGLGRSDRNDLEIALRFFARDEDERDNVPAGYSFFYQVEFESVRLRIAQAEGVQIAPLAPLDPARAEQLVGR